jgi:hypothetical protein
VEIRQLHGDLLKGCIGEGRSGSTLYSLRENQVVVVVRQKEEEEEEGALSSTLAEKKAGVME